MGTKFAPVLATRGARFEPDSAERTENYANRQEFDAVVEGRVLEL